MNASPALARVCPCHVVKHIAPTLDQATDRVGKLKQKKNYEKLHEHLKTPGKNLRS